MEFEWDKAKDQSNRRKHGISFEEAALIFAGPVLTQMDSRTEYGEVREISIGAIRGLTVVAIVHTDRDGRTRLISARPASRKEREDYYDYTQKSK